MKRKFRNFTVSELFDIAPGDFHAKSELEPGEVPLISCGEENNGFVGRYDIPKDRSYERVLTVAFNGFPLTTRFHPYRFGAKDDVAVLVPINPMPEGVMIYVASLLNAMRWRYSYGRKCFQEKLQNVPLRLPVAADGSIDEAGITALVNQAFDSIRSKTESSVKSLVSPSVPTAGSDTQAAADPTRRKRRVLKIA